MVQDKNNSAALWLDRVTFTLIISALALIPFGTASQIPCALLAFCGITTIIQTKGTLFRQKGINRFLLLMLCYALPIALSIIGSVNTKSPVKVFSIALLSLGGGLAAIHCLQNEKYRRKLLNIIMGIVAFWVIDTLFQIMTGQDIFGFTPFRETRFGGPFSTQYLLGVYLGSFSAFLLFYGIRKHWSWHYNLAVFSVVSFVMLMSNTRSGWVMFAVLSLIFVYFTFIRNRKHPALIVACFLTACMAVFFGLYKLSPQIAKRVDQSRQVFNGDLDSLENALTGRLGIWHASANVIKANPVNGIGARNLREVYTDYRPEPGYGNFSGENMLDWVSDPHQLVLETGVGTGMIGLTGLLLIYLLFWKTWHDANPAQRLYGLPFAVMLLAAYFPLNTHAAHYSSKYALELWLMIALFVAYLTAEWSEENDQITASDS